MIGKSLVFLFYNVFFAYFFLLMLFLEPIFVFLKEFMDRSYI